MNSTLDEKHWFTLLRRIRDGKCTPFLGAGINEGILALGSDIARILVKRHDNYPFTDPTDLARVTQVLAINMDDPMFPKDEIVELLKEQLEQWKRNVAEEDFFKSPDQPLGILADLPLPIYITTNYDKLMEKALETRQKAPRGEFCRWNRYVREIISKPSIFDSESDFEPKPAVPVVFHLHGCKEVKQSLVLTEDDYLDFLVSISRHQNLLPPCIQEALAGTSLIFIGYRLADLDFRVLFRGLVGSMEASLRQISVAVQLPLEDLKQQKYWVDYFDKMKVLIYWGTAKQFTAELHDRWKEFQNDRETQ